MFLIFTKLKVLFFFFYASQATNPISIFYGGSHHITTQQTPAIKDHFPNPGGAQQKQSLKELIENVIQLKNNMYIHGDKMKQCKRINYRTPKTLLLHSKGQPSCLIYIHNGRL